MSNLVPNPATATVAGVVKTGTGLTIAADGTASVNYGTTATTAAAGNDSRVTGAEQVANKGLANGYAPLDSTSRLPTANLPLGIVGGVNFQGTWNASTNTPTLTSGTGTKGFLYRVATAGTTTLDGISVWNVGDDAVFDGTVWSKLDGIATEVLTVAGRTGNVVLAVADVSGALPSSGGTATGLILAADPSVPLGAATKQYVDARAAAGYVRTNYAASGAISPADNMSLINASSTVTMTLAAGTTDNHLLSVNAYGTGSVVLQTSIRGTSQSITMSGTAGTLPQNLSLHWLADLATYTVE